MKPQDLLQYERHLDKAQFMNDNGYDAVKGYVGSILPQGKIIITNGW
jgi:hypothetical protein